MGPSKGGFELVKEGQKKEKGKGESITLICCPGGVPAYQTRERTPAVGGWQRSASDRAVKKTKWRGRKDRRLVTLGGVKNCKKN